MEEKLKQIKSNLQVELKDAKQEADILNIKAAYIGKKSEFQSILASLKDMSVDDKRKYGSLIIKNKYIYF